MSGFLKKTNDLELVDSGARSITDHINVTQEVNLDVIETKVDGIEENATSDQTNSEIVSAVNSEMGNTDWQGSAAPSDAVYDASWDGDTEAPSKNAVYDKVNAIDSSISTLENGGVSWSSLTANATADSKNGYMIDATSNTVTLANPSSPSAGDFFLATVLNGDNDVTVAEHGPFASGDKLECVYLGGIGWVVHLMEGTIVGIVTPPYIGPYGYVSGGVISAYTDVIERFAFASSATGDHIGDLTEEKYTCTGHSSSTDGYTSGGSTGLQSLNVIERFAFASSATGDHIGDLTVVKNLCAGHSSSTEGYTSGGSTSSQTNVIERFSFASSADGDHIGDLTEEKDACAGHSSSTDGYTSGGNAVADVIERFSFASSADGADVGDLTVAKYTCAGHSSSDHGYVSGGYTGSQTTVIERFSFASSATGDHIGDLTVVKNYCTGHSSSTEGYVGGGRTGSQSLNVIERFSFASSADGADVGDLTVEKYICAGHEG